MAADMLSVGVGGYMQQWFGMSSVDDTSMDKDKMVNDGIAQQSDSEIFFRGKLESDSGLTFSVKVELEGNNSDGATAIDESQLTIGGEFGKITLGAEDPASTLTHHGGLDVGVSLNCGDTHKWIGGLAGCSHNGFGTYGHGHGDKNQVMYFSPRVSGVQFGLSYIPDTGQEGRQQRPERQRERCLGGRRQLCRRFRRRPQRRRFPRPLPGRHGRPDGLLYAQHEGG